MQLALHIKASFECATDPTPPTSSSALIPQESIDENASADEASQTIPTRIHVRQ